MFIAKMSTAVILLFIWLVEFEMYTTRSDTDFISVGCFERAPKADHTKQVEKDTINECYQLAKSLDLEFFAVQNSHCFIYKTYNFNMDASTCVNGTGGNSVVDVYAIVIHGRWAPWSHWTECSTTCGRGRKMKFRICESPATSRYGLPCETRDRGRSSYEVDEVACEGGIACKDVCRPRHQEGGCCKIPFKYKDTFYHTCIHDGDGRLWCGTKSKVHWLRANDWKYCVEERYGTWEVWNQWSVCSSFCTGGRKMRHRACRRSGIKNGNRLCQDGNTENVSSYSIEEVSCNTFVNCPVPGGWNKWSVVRQCSSSGNGILKNKYRICSDPYPMYGGQQCQIDGSNNRIFYQSALEIYNSNEVCTTDEAWVKWSVWSGCSSTCSGGKQMRHRWCDKGFRCERDEHGGKSSYEVNIRNCNEGINCSYFCKNRTNDGRCCILSANSVHKGINCNGNTPSCQIENDDRNTHACIIEKNGNWNIWSNWTYCSSSCDYGYKMRYRLCNKPSATNNGLQCGTETPRARSSFDIEEVKCNIGIRCPANLSLILGGAIGGVMAVLLIILCSFALFSHRKMRKDPTNNMASMNNGTKLNIIESREDSYVDASVDYDDMKSIDKHQIEYSEVGSSGGRIGIRDKLERSSYVQVKTEDVFYPALLTRQDIADISQ